MATAEVLKLTKGIDDNTVGRSRPNKGKATTTCRTPISRSANSPQ